MRPTKIGTSRDHRGRWGGSGAPAMRPTAHVLAVAVLALLCDEACYGQQPPSAGSLAGGGSVPAEVNLTAGVFLSPLPGELDAFINEYGRVSAAAGLANPSGQHPVGRRLDAAAQRRRLGEGGGGRSGGLIEDAVYFVEVAVWSERRLAGKHNVSSNISLSLYNDAGCVARMGRRRQSAALIVWFHVCWKVRNNGPLASPYSGMRRPCCR